MSRLQQLLLTAKAGLEPWESIPPSQWPAIAMQCGPAEIQEIRDRIATLQDELKEVESWDGDTQDDIFKAIHFFEQLLILTTTPNSTSPQNRGPCGS